MVETMVLPQHIKHKVIEGWDKRCRKSCHRDKDEAKQREHRSQIDWNTKLQVHVIHNLQMVHQNMKASTPTSKLFSFHNKIYNTKTRMSKRDTKKQSQLSSQMTQMTNFKGNFSQQHKYTA